MAGPQQRIADAIEPICVSLSATGLHGEPFCDGDVLVDYKSSRFSVASDSLDATTRRYFDLGFRDPGIVPEEELRLLCVLLRLSRDLPLVKTAYQALENQTGIHERLVVMIDWPVAPQHMKAQDWTRAFDLLTVALESRVGATNPSE